jgi:hypothetical protein
MKPVATPMVMLKNRAQKNNPNSILQKALLNAPATVRLLNDIEATTKIASGSADLPVAFSFFMQDLSFYKRNIIYERNINFMKL